MFKCYVYDERRLEAEELQVLPLITYCTSISLVFGELDYLCEVVNELR